MSGNYRVLVSDKLSSEGIELLNSVPSIEVHEKTGLSASDLGGIIGDYDALIIRSSTSANEKLLANAKRLKVIGRAGIGVDNVDVNAASNSGVIVMNTPDGNATTTAEHALSLLMSLARHIPQAHASLQSGKWEKSKFKGSEVSGKTLGILGLGNIGRLVAQKAKGLNMRVVAFDPVVTKKKAREYGTELVDFESLLSCADFISIHTPLSAATKGLLGEKAFKIMKSGVRIINAARGGIVDERALFMALETGIVAGAALDVFEVEPPSPDNPLLSHPKVVTTPHLGASTDEAQNRVAIQIAEQVRDFLLDGVIKNALNVPNMSKEELADLKPQMNMARILGAFASQCSQKKATKLNVTYLSGNNNKSKIPVTNSAVAGYLTSRQNENIDWLMAPHKASLCGLETVESFTNQENSNSPSICITIYTSEGPLSISGTLFADKGPRIVKIDDYFVEALPGRHMLYLKNNDTPGIIGQIGTFLGENQINIARMQLGLSSNREAISLWNLDSPMSHSQLENIRKLPQVSAASMIELPI